MKKNKKITIEGDTVIIPCMCGSSTCTSFLYVRKNNDIDVVFYGKRQFTVAVPEKIRKAIFSASVTKKK